MTTKKTGATSGEAKTDDLHLTVVQDTPAESEATVTADLPEPLAPSQVRQQRAALSLSRNQLAELTGLSLSRCWAAETEGKDVTDEHRRVIAAALQRVRLHGLPEHLRKTNQATGSAGHKKSAITRQVLADRLVEVCGLLDEAAAVKTLREVRELVDRARLACLGQAEPSQTPENPTGDGSTAETNADEPAEV